MMNTKTFAGFTARIILLPAILSYGCSKDIEQPDEENYEEIPEAVITDFQPKTGSTDNIVTITGENFGTDMANVRVTFGNKNVDKIEELSDTKIVVKVPLVEVSEDTDIPVSVTVGDASKTFTEKFSYIYVPYTWIWISGSFNNWSTDTAMEKDPVDPYTFHYTSDIIPATPDENGERAFKFLTKSVSWPWANTYNAAQEKAPITDTRVLFQANAGEEGKDWKWEFETWQCGYAYDFTLSIKPGEEKMTCTPVDGTPVPPKTYSTVSTLKTSVNLSDFRTMGFTSDGKLIAIAGWDKIYSIDTESGQTEILYDVNWEWDYNGPREVNGMAITPDGEKIYLACPTTTYGAGDLYYLAGSSAFATATAIISGMNKYTSMVAVNPSDGTVFFNATDNGETFFRLDSEDGAYSKQDGVKSLGGSNGASRLYFTQDGSKAYRLIYEGNDIWDVGAIYAYDYDASTKSLTNERLLAGSDSESGYADGTGAEARLRRPYGGAIDNDGNLYVTDSDNHCIRKITPDGVVTTFAGANEAGNIDGSLSDARFTKPSSIAIAEDGTIYIGQNGKTNEDGSTVPAAIRVIR